MSDQINLTMGSHQDKKIKRETERVELFSCLNTPRSHRLFSIAPPLVPTGIAVLTFSIFLIFFLPRPKAIRIFDGWKA